MEYCVRRIKTEEEIRTCEKFEVNHFQWVEGPRPVTYGYMGYLESRGLFVEMHCRESAPRRECREPEGRYSKEAGRRVCDDSAMEIFLGFPGEDGETGADSLYVNFEINANGVMFANFGKGRKNRSFLSDEVYRKAAPKAFVEDKEWSIRVLFPQSFIREISGVDLSRPGTRFFCNFYKISETPEIEHYGCFAPVQSETPNFHMPRCFAGAVVE